MCSTFNFNHTLVSLILDLVRSEIETAFYPPPHTQNAEHSWVSTFHGSPKVGQTGSLVIDIPVLCMMCVFYCRDYRQPIGFVLIKN